MTDLYPEPPHLSAFVEPGLEQSAALQAASEVLRAADCVFTGDVLVARDGSWFRDVSDVERMVIRHSGSPSDVLGRPDLLRIQFRHRSVGVVSLGLASASRFGEQHPLEVAIHAGPLSLPVELWSRTDRQAARRIFAWTERLLVALAGATGALYGAIGTESVFPNPHELTANRRSGLRPTTWFWSSRLSEVAASREGELVSSLAEAAVKRSREGTLFRGWRPGSDTRVDEPGIDRVMQFLSRGLGTMT